jgi:phosphonoacetaldehyde hydrolase
MHFRYLRSYQGPVKGVIFDWAGTIIDFGCFAPAGVFIQVFAERKVEITMAEARAPMGLNKRDHIVSIASMPRVREAWQQAHGRDWSEADIEAMYAAFIPAQVAMIPKHADIIPGISEVVSSLQSENVAIASTSGYYREMMKVAASAAAEDGLQFDKIVCSSDVAQGRPAPWMALKAAEQINAYPPTACIKIGDTIADIEAGLNAGMWSVGIVDSSSDMGLTLAEFTSLSEAERESRRQPIRQRMYRYGAHFVIDNYDQFDEMFAAVSESVSGGEMP